jgi:hypothetical protein
LARGVHRLPPDATVDHERNERLQQAGKPMKTPQNPSFLSVPARVEELDDTALRGGHALLDSDRARDFACWIDVELAQLEGRFQQFMTPKSLRRSLGR